MRTRSLAVVATAILIAALTTVAMAADPIVGTWKFNPAKSRMSQAPKERTETYREIEGEQIELTYAVIQQDGSRHLFKAAWPRVGGPVHVLQTGNDKVSYVEILLGPGNWYYVALQDGKETGVVHKTVSKDGKILEETVRWTDAQGKPHHELVVLDKQ